MDHALRPHAPPARWAAMKAILLCAGRGSRLAAFTRDRPKCLVEVGGGTILDHQLAALHCAGIEEVVIVAGYRAERIVDHLADRRVRGHVRVMRNPDWLDGGSISSVWTARALLHQPFLIANGDTVFSPALLSRALARQRPGVSLLVERAEPAPDDMRVQLGGDRILRVAKTLRGAAHRSLGVVLSNEADGAAYRAALAEVIRGPLGLRHYHHDVVDRLAGIGHVHPLLVANGSWQEFDTPGDLDSWKLRTAADTASAGSGRRAMAC